MSLVVGKIVDDFAFIVADTYLTRTDAAGDSFHLKNHGLKVHVLTPALAIGLAGLFFPALEAIKILNDKSRERPAFEVLSEIWVQLVRDKGYSVSDCDFLVLEKRDGRVMLHKITQGEVRNITSGYIGDPEAYKTFMKFFEGTKPDSKFSKPIAMKQVAKSAMERLTSTNAMKTKTVGAISHFPLCVELDPSLGLIYPIAASGSQSQEMGTETHAVLTTVGDRGAVGYYFSGSKTGYLFISADPNSPHGFNNLSFDDFKKVVSQKFKIDLVGNEIKYA